VYRAGYPFEIPTVGVRDSTPESPRKERLLTSNGYHISVDDGRESFYALCIENPDDEDMWLLSDTVRSLRKTR
jgi:hypothetical protein